MLRREPQTIGVRNGPWFRENFVVTDKTGRALRLFADRDWVDWQANGDVLIATDGEFYRLPRQETLSKNSDALAGGLNSSPIADL